MHSNKLQFVFVTVPGYSFLFSTEDNALRAGTSSNLLSFGDFNAIKTFLTSYRGSNCVRVSFPSPLRTASQNDLKIAGDKLYSPWTRSSSIIDLGARVSVVFCTSGSEKLTDSPGKTSRIGSEKIGKHWANAKGPSVMSLPIFRQSAEKRIDEGTYLDQRPDSEKPLVLLFEATAS